MMKIIQFLLSFIWTADLKNQTRIQIESIIILSTLMVSCSNKETITQQIKEMQSSPICVPREDMVFLCEEGITPCHSNNNTPFYLVVFSDSTGCSSCAVNRLSKWNEFLNLEREEKLSLIFILNPPKAEYNDIVDAYSSSGLDHSIIIDSCGVFLEKNPKIPPNGKFHTFLMDSKGNVVLVGNPLENKKIQELMYELINNNNSL